MVWVGLDVIVVNSMGFEVVVLDGFGVILVKSMSAEFDIVVPGSDGNVVKLVGFNFVVSVDWDRVVIKSVILDIAVSGLDEIEV